jgi:chromosome segregation ATPase
VEKLKKDQEDFEKQKAEQLKQIEELRNEETKKLKYTFFYCTVLSCFNVRNLTLD